MVIDRAANTLKQAKELTLSSGSIRFKEQIGGRDTQDFFRFRLNSRSSVNLSLNGKADLQLLNGKGRSLHPGKSQDSILNNINAELNAGTYYVRLASRSNQSSRYTLTATAALSQPMTSEDGMASGTNQPIVFPAAANSQTIASDDGSTIDLMIVYTTDVKVSTGGTNAINQIIQNAVDEVNQGYINSGIVQRLRLVHTAEVNYAETGNSNTDLARLQGKSDGYLDTVHAMRDAHGADIVSMFVKTSEAGGNSYTMDQVRQEFEAYAFSVVQIDNVKTRFSLGHEVGHNLGAAHDRAHADSQAAFSDAYGYITPSGIGDVMSYAGDRRNYYASPNVSISGEALGRVGEADVVRTFNAVRFTAANWRKSVID